MGNDTNLSAVEVSGDLGLGRRTAADIVAAALREAINAGALSDGAELSQAAVAAHFGVSRVPVREAMRELQAEGLIESQAHRLAVVRGLELDAIVELYAMRALLEGWLIEEATPRIDADAIADARRLNAQMREETDPDRWLELNAAFHTTLYEAAGADLARQMLEPLRTRTERYSRLWGQGVRLHRPGGEAADQHDAILALVERGDGAGARAAVEEHVRLTRDRVIEQGRRVRAGERSAANN